MEKKNMVFLSVIAVATLLTAVVGTTFSFFTATVKPDGEKPVQNTTVTTPTLGITYAQEGTINMTNVVPGAADKSFIFSVTNGSDVSTTYKLVWSEVTGNITGTEASSKDLTYKIDKCSDGASCASTTPLQAATPLTKTLSAIPSASAEVVTGNGTNYYKVTVHFERTEEEQNDMQGKTFTGKIIVGSAAQDASGLGQ